MGYLNNTTRTLDAILTKRGRELLSSGGNFTVSKFALGDDEVDYDLWDTTHIEGTDYYGAVIENLPALEPFNDPSEIMKYKLVTRSVGTRAMAKLDGLTTSAELTTGLTWVSAPIVSDGGTTTSRCNVAGDTTLAEFGAPGVSLKITHKNNPGALDQESYDDETYTITLLDSSVALLAPRYSSSPSYHVTKSNNELLNSLWVPYVNNVRHISQTIPGCKRSGDYLVKVGFENGIVMVYPKRIAQEAKTSIIITGESSGAVIEFDVTIQYSTT